LGCRILQLLFISYYTFFLSTLLQQTYEMMTIRYLFECDLHTVRKLQLTRPFLKAVTSSLQKFSTKFFVSSGVHMILNTECE